MSVAAMEASPSCVVVDIVADGNSQSNKLAAGAMPVAPRRLDGVPDNSKSNKSPGLVPHETKKRWLSPLVPENALSNKKPDAVPYEPDYNPLSNKMPTAEPFFGRDNSHSNKLPTGAVPFHYVRASPSTVPGFVQLEEGWMQRLKEEEVPNVDLSGLGDPDTLLGRGAFGEVRRVLWRKTPVAAKCAHPHMPREQKLLFLRELELMMRSRHPNIVQVYSGPAPPHNPQPSPRVSERLPARRLSSSGTSTSRSSS